MFPGKKFPTWKRHLPQKGFQGIRSIQVGNKSAEIFPTWTEWTERQAEDVRSLADCSGIDLFAGLAVARLLTATTT